MNHGFNLPKACLALVCVFAVSGCVSSEPGNEQLSKNQGTGSTSCEQLDEQACIAQSGCEPEYIGQGCVCPACVPGDSCPPCECPPPQDVFIGCIEIDPCRDLDENACLADASCEPIYGALPCPAIACAPDEPNCPTCDYSEEFLGCETREEPPICPPVCDIWCEYGNVIDDNGCPTCECNPPPPGHGCEGRDEQQCLADPSCVAEYEAQPCAEFCAPDDCGPCDPNPVFSGCHDRCDGDPCTGLSEDECVAAFSCEPIYVGWGCACPACEPGTDCPPCDCPEPPYGEEYAGCEQIDPCTRYDEQSCIAAPQCHPLYGVPPCAAIACDPASPDECPVCDDTEQFIGCSG